MKLLIIFKFKNTIVNKVINLIVFFTNSKLIVYFSYNRLIHNKNYFYLAKTGYFLLYKFKNFSLITPLNTLVLNSISFTATFNKINNIYFFKTIF